VQRCVVAGRIGFACQHRPSQVNRLRGWPRGMMVWSPIGDDDPITHFRRWRPGAHANKMRTRHFSTARNQCGRSTHKLHACSRCGRSTHTLHTCKHNLGSRGKWGLCVYRPAAAGDRTLYYLPSLRGMRARRQHYSGSNPTGSKFLHARTERTRLLVSQHRIQGVQQTTVPCFAWYERETYGCRSSCGQ